MDGTTFREIRIEVGITQRELAERLQRYQWLISNYECGKNAIPDDIAEWMTKLRQGTAASSPPKRRQAESRKTPPTQRHRILSATSPPSSDTLCWQCLCVTDRYIPCGCRSWVG